MNIAVVRGRLSRPPEARDLPSGDQLVQLDVTVAATGDRRAETVPVAWLDAPAAALAWAPDDEVVVIGRVRRRFFRVGATTQSRTEVVADRVLPARPAGRVTKAVRSALDEVEEALLA